MLKKRLTTIANLVTKNAKVLDVGTDHAYLPIYLIQNDITKNVIASDISENALDGAKKNITKANVKGIKLICTDGINGITDRFDTLIISGMGTNTIISILKGHILPDKIILSSQNELYILRKYMNKIGYKITDEKVVYENNKYYDILAYQKGKEKLSKKILRYGKSGDKKYLRFLYQKESNIFKKVGFFKKIKMIIPLLELKKMSI